MVYYWLFSENNHSQWYIIFSKIPLPVVCYWLMRLTNTNGVLRVNENVIIVDCVLFVCYWYCYNCWLCIIEYWDLPHQYLVLWFQLSLENTSCMWMCVCMCVCMIKSLNSFKFKASMQQYENILTPKCYFCATHFPNYWFRNFEKEIFNSRMWYCALFCLLFPRISLFVYLDYWTTQSVTDTVLHFMRGWMVNNELKRM
jgi:hypothetical protein